MTERSSDTAPIVALDGDSLLPEHLVRIGYDSTVEVELTENAWEKVREGRAVVDRILENNELAYGINTGFGNFANVVIQPEELQQLQENLIRSHAAGVGTPLTVARTRMLLALRINVLAKGHSGIREGTLRALLAALRANCVPWVPERGTVGASGDLAPLAHLALGLMGEGKMWDPKQQGYHEAKEVLAAHGLQPIRLAAKEGLALINGTQLITALGAEAVVRARRICRTADVVAALTLETLKASATPMHPAIHAARPHRGQGLVAGRLRDLLNFGHAPSKITFSHRNCGKVQDSYTLRCIPQVHGVCHDSIMFAYDIITTEMNSATDNPMIFATLSRPSGCKNNHSECVNEDYTDDQQPHVDEWTAHALADPPLPPRHRSRTTSSNAAAGTQECKVPVSEREVRERHRLLASLGLAPLTPGLVMPLASPINEMEHAHAHDFHAPASLHVARSPVGTRSPHLTARTLPDPEGHALPPANLSLNSSVGVAQEPQEADTAAPQPQSRTPEPPPNCSLSVGGSGDLPQGPAVTSVPSAQHAPLGIILSGGNFHGEYPAKAMDFLAIGVHELASISERRIERLVNPHLSGLPAFLVAKGGLHSGFMIAHCTAAALVSENKVLCHPSSVDSISTSAGQEDHVSMGGFAARKALQVVEHVEAVVAIELLAACQALEFHRPLTTTKPLEAVHALVRQSIPAWTHDRIMHPDIEQAAKLVREESVWFAAAPYVDAKHH